MKPIIAIPMGDPAGIGPEIVAKALAREETFQCARCVVVGDKKVMEQAIRIVDLPMAIHVVKEPREGRFEEHVINLMNLDNVDMGRLKLGEISSMCGQAAYEYIAESISLANEGKVAAVSTTPINKESLRAAGVPFIGHTEIFGALTDTPDPLTMFEVRNMRVFFLTRHVSLRKACDMITKERVMDYVKRCTQALRQLGVEDGTMAIAGLNPHSGEHGLFGDEEMDAIYPAVEALQAEGYKVVGPVGADSVFHLALQGKFNSVLSLYHDQGHIATKTLDFERTIAVTAGMPILRTSVDHGTAMDIAGTGIASDVSMVEAIRLAAKYSPAFLRKDGD
ncbi:4-hydroxythreonine-4-phosphate dehydrogenase PdxA [Enterocloster citroniae]|jgi:4-phospho-D-threonate 3-dehydrogenase / 4-phospho-D-erythronate 3-dehydrogenase|uniref:4-hydroxythreonine-4-phosphate dehydrogenase PdxA n=1 Tax=Enterocloster citroniae TaxID=358743 RepID=UPI0032C17759